MRLHTESLPMVDTPLVTKETVASARLALIEQGR
ncbi:MAG: hypothetical protein ACI9UN_001593, partial [Granulosicoccus sp.]